MTIAYLVKMYPRFSETFIVNEILELERQGEDLRIYSLHKPNDGRFHAALARVRAPVVYLPEYLPAEHARLWAAQRALWAADRGRYLRVLGYALGRGNRAAFKRFLQGSVLAEHFLRQPVTHVHAHFASSATAVALFAHLLSGVPYSFTAHAKDIYLDDVDPDVLRDKLRGARFAVTVSDFNRAYLSRLIAEPGRTRLGGLLPAAQLALTPARVRRLYNGIDVTQFDPGPGALPQAAREPLILAVGRLVEKKGFDVLVRACALLRERGRAFHCAIIGKGPQEAELRALVAAYDLHDRVTLVGALSQDEVADAYRRAALFALPCVIGADGNRDGLPTVLLEAMAMRLPVVSTDVTGVPEIVDDGMNGCVVPQHDAEALAGALERLLADPALRERMGAAGRNKVECAFNLQRNGAVLREWLAESGVPAAPVGAPQPAFAQ